jgi:hypothetical protein
MEFLEYLTLRRIGNFTTVKIRALTEAIAL